MDIKSIAMKLIAQKLGGNSAQMSGVLGSLIGQGNEMDVGGLVSGLKEKGLGDVADSWLGDGENAEISADQLKDVLGADKVAQAAQQLGTDESSLLSGLKDSLPQVVDQASKGGSLLGSLGGLGGMAKNCLLYTSPSPRDATLSRMPSSA